MFFKNEIDFFVAFFIFSTPQVVKHIKCRKDLILIEFLIVNINLPLNICKKKK